MITANELFTLRPDSSQRPPHWRWELARLLNDSRRDGAAVVHPDQDVTSAARLLDVTTSSAGEESRVAAFLSVPTHHADAYVFHNQSTLAGDIDPPASADKDAARDYPVYGPMTAKALARAHLEALILARKKPESIARAVGLTPEAVTQYEKWWYDVRDRLDRPGWVAANVIGSLHQGPPSLLLPALVKAYGYYTRSSRVVQSVVGTFDSTAARAAARDPSRFFSADAVSAGGLKAAMAVRLMPLTRKTYARVMELHQSAMEVAVKAGQAGGSDIEQRYRGALGELFHRVDYKYRAPPVELPPSDGPLPRLVDVVDDAG